MPELQPSTTQTAQWTHRFLELPRVFYHRQSAQALTDPYYVTHQAELMSEMELPAEWCELDQISKVFSGNDLPEGSKPYSTVYSGHQFGHYVPQLGDGRALMLGEWTNSKGQAYELQLKGSGLTPFSRMGDGRAVLRSSIREYLASEALHALGIPTTRALALIGSDDPVYREEPETSAVVTRVAPSFLRFGHFEFFYYTEQHEALEKLADFAIEHYFPASASLPPNERYAHWFEDICQRTGKLVSLWQGIGFTHGVLNTDNMSILGLTLDYGPYGFMDRFKAHYICNHSDDFGRYAFDQQPGIGKWNLARLGDALSPLISKEQIKKGLSLYEREFFESFLALFRKKLGLQTELESDINLIKSMFTAMEANKVDYTQFFRQLASIQAEGTTEAFQEKTSFSNENATQWLGLYQQRLESETLSASERKTLMNQVNPVYILRNHLAEIAIRQAKEGDYSEVQRLQKLLSQPYTEQADFTGYEAPAPDWAQHLCISCSS